MSDPILLPLSKLRAYHRQKTKWRITDFQKKHGRLPDEQTSFAEWAEATPSLHLLLLELRCIPEGNQIAAQLILRAARRALPSYEYRYPGDARPREAIELAEKKAAGEDVPRAELRAVYEAACDAEAEADADSWDAPAAYDNIEATQEEMDDYAEIQRAAYAANCATFAAKDVGMCINVCQALSSALSATEEGSADPEWEQQRADLVELLVKH